MTYEIKTATLANYNLSYLIAGEGETLLVLHTSGGPLWTPLLEKLATVRQIVMPILPGFGETPMVEGVASIANLADLVAEFAQVTIADLPVDVFGASFGGQVALYLAASHPDIVTDMVLEAPSGVAVGSDPNAQDAQAARTGLFAHPEKAKHLAPSSELAAANRAAFEAYGGPMLVDDVLIPKIPTIEAGLLVLMGTLDRVTPPEAGQFLAASVPGAKLTYIHDAAHAIQVDQAESAFRVVRHFLDKGPAFIVASREYMA